jgi:hypothetical protein
VRSELQSVRFERGAVVCSGDRNKQRQNRTMCLLKEFGINKLFEIKNVDIKKQLKLQGAW